MDFPYLQAEDTKAPLPTRLRLSESVSCPCAAGREVPVDAQSFAQGRPAAERVFVNLLANPPMLGGLT